MKKILLLACTVFTLFIACLKKDEGCQPVPPAQEEAQLLAYANTNGMAVIKHSSGLYYQIINPGSGPVPTLDSRVFVTYTGKFLNGTVFDQKTSPINFQLGQLIEGWQIGLSLLQKGGQIHLLVPSALAYGCMGNPVIAPNLPLFFDVNLVDVQ